MNHKPHARLKEEAPGPNMAYSILWGYLLGHLIMALVLWIVLYTLAAVTGVDVLPLYVCWIITEIPAAYNAFNRLSPEEW